MDRSFTAAVLLQDAKRLFFGMFVVGVVALIAASAVERLWEHNSSWWR